MSVKITFIGENENGPIFEAFDLTTNEAVVAKNWFEKSKNKWHIVLGPNSANRKYIAHNEFNAKNVNGEYVVEDKTTGPRVLGTAQPDKNLVPFMTPEDKKKYDDIIGRAMDNRAQSRTIELTEEQKLMAQIARLEKKLATLADPTVE